MSRFFPAERPTIPVRTRISSPAASPHEMRNRSFPRWYMYTVHNGQEYHARLYFRYKPSYIVTENSYGCYELRTETGMTWTKLIVRFGLCSFHGAWSPSAVGFDLLRDPGSRFSRTSSYSDARSNLLLVHALASYTLYHLFDVYIVYVVKTVTFKQVKEFWMSYSVHLTFWSLEEEKSMTIDANDPDMDTGYIISSRIHHLESV